MEAVAQCQRAQWDEVMMMPGGTFGRLVAVQRAVNPGQKVLATGDPGQLQPVWRTQYGPEPSDLLPFKHAGWRSYWERVIVLCDLQRARDPELQVG